MRKLLITLIIVLLAVPVFSMGSISRPKDLAVNPDVLLNPTASPFQGRVAILNGSTIKVNKDYLKNIVAYVYQDNSVLVRISSGFADISPKCPNLPAEYHGIVGHKAYKTFADQTAVWKPTTASIMDGAASFDANGVTINPANIKVNIKPGSGDGNPYQSKGFVIEKQACYNNAIGTYPDWKVYFDLRMTQAELEKFLNDAADAGYTVQTVIVGTGDGTQ